MTPLRAAAPLASIVDGQVFDAPLHVAAAPGSDATCPSIAFDPLNAMTLQFAFARDAQGLSLSASRTNLSAPANISPPGEIAPLTPVAADGSFADLSVNVAENARVMLASGTIAVSQSDAAGKASALQFSSVSGREQVIEGDLVFICTFTASFSAVPDTTPPLAFIPGCTASDGRTPAPCLLLADQEIAIDFSEPVNVHDALPLVSAVDGDGNAIPLTAPSRFALETFLYVRGAWPLGGSVTLTLAAGLDDRAGNSSERAVSQTFSVVADPGDLDAAGNSGFETGDFSGYTLTLNRPPSLGSDLGSGLAPLPALASDSSALARIVDGLHGVAPTEGTEMAAIGADQGCAAPEIDLTAGFVVPADAATLLLDANLLSAHTAAGGSMPPAYVYATVTGPGGRFGDLLRKLPDAQMLPADGAVMQSGWQQIGVDVSALAGEQVVLTIHVYAATLLGPPPLCLPGIVLLDNLRFA